jgi:predicted flavoprotein YhiN
LNQWSDRERREVLELARNWPVAFSGTEGYAKAEVTLGGVATAGLSSKTMESRTVRGLHFIGEVVDVTGWLGGYNFQWAWASAHAAGRAI